MEKETRDTTVIRIKTASLEKVREYLKRSGANIAHVVSEALEYWAEREIPKRLKAMNK